MARPAAVASRQRPAGRRGRVSVRSEIRPHQETLMGYATIDRTARTLTRRRESRRRTAEMLTLLSQDRVWTDRCWQRHRLAWMAPSYRANLLAFLERHRLRLYL